MKEKFRILFAFLAVFAFTVLISDLLIKEVVKPFENSFVEKTESDAEVSAEYLYKISVFNGKIAVFDKDSKIPYKVYDTYVDSLPEEERNQLIKGINVNTSSELMKIIEEYTS